MAKTTIRVNAEELERLNYYKYVFNFSSIAETLKSLLDKAGLASYEDIRRYRKMKGATE